MCSLNEWSVIFCTSVSLISMFIVCLGRKNFLDKPLDLMLFPYSGVPSIMKGQEETYIMKFKEMLVQALRSPNDEVNNF